MRPLDSTYRGVRLKWRSNSAESSKRSAHQAVGEFKEGDPGERQLGVSSLGLKAEGSLGALESELKGPKTGISFGGHILK